jgi:O-antigen/teichoic acid export membrane protein
LITNILGPQHAATFYVSVMLAQILYIMPMTMTQSLFAEASHHNDTLIPRLYQAGKFTALIMTPAIIILALFGRYVLLIFGSDYAENGTHLLQLLALSGYFFAFNSLITTVLYVRRRIPLLSAINLTYALCALFLSYAFAHAGLLGIGIAWLVSQSLATVLFATTIIAQEFKHRRHTTQGRAE